MGTGLERRLGPNELEEGQVFESPIKDGSLGSLGSFIERKVIRATTSAHSRKKEIEHKKDIGDKILAYQRDIAIHRLNKDHKHIVEKGRLE